VITGVLSVRDLAAVGITPTATVPEGTPFRFDNTFMSASIQTAPVPIPEASTWAMMTLGLTAIGWLARTRAPKTSLA
jgi:hypothetical protein